MNCFVLLFFIVRQLTKSSLEKQENEKQREVTLACFFVVVNESCEYEICKQFNYNKIIIVDL